MGWDKDGRYYTRSRRVNGRVVREYVGGGRIGELAAQFDALKQVEREAVSAGEKADREEVAVLDSSLVGLGELVDLLVQAALLAAGFRQHNRGNWRKRREQRDEAQ